MKLDRRAAFRLIALGALSGCARGGGTLRRAEGEAFGTRVSITLAEKDADGPLLTEAFAVLARLESIFTLWDPDSPIRRLNRDGRLDSTPRELLDVLRLCGEIHLLTGGAFDPTVQPLWDLYESHFSRSPNDTAGPDAEAVGRARSLVGWEKVTISGESVALAEPGMALTLNGIAPGYAADRLAAWLSQRGICGALIDAGEFRAIGTRPDGSPWAVDIRSGGESGAVVATLPLADAGLATSSGVGTVFDVAGRFHHIFDPRAETFADSRRTVAVMAPEAATADALATAGVVMEWAEFKLRAETLAGVVVHQWMGNA